MPDLLQIYGYDGEVRNIVECFPTCSEHFVVTESLSFPGWWNLTHKKTTSIVIGPFRTQEEVRFMAGIFAALPMPWEKYTVEMMSRESPRFSKVLHGSWDKLPKEIRNWRTRVALDQKDDAENEFNLKEVANGL